MSEAAPDPDWSLYVIRTRAGQLYTGITRDVERRLEEHGSGRGAQDLRGRGPLTLVYRVLVGERGLALQLEGRLKRLERSTKEALVLAAPDRAELIARVGPGAPAR